VDGPPQSGIEREEATLKHMIKLALLLIPALALTMPAFALAPGGLSDSEQPGSVIVFPKFVNMPAVTADGNQVPRTEIEIGAICPRGATCVEHQTVKVRFQWVCPGVENLNSNICKATAFDVVLSVDGKLAFAADGTTINSNSPRAPAAPCPRGYLIGWVINPANDQPVKFDGLIGTAVIRGPNLGAGPNAGSSSAVSAYDAIPIQADPGLSNFPAANSAITLPGKHDADGVVQMLEESHRANVPAAVARR
jgi:hypothetical protein